MQPQKENMEINEDIVIVGAGIAGLATSVALHRLGVRSIVLESSESLRTSGFALALWTNAWRALDALGVGDSLRQLSLHFTRFQAFSADSGLPIAEISLEANNKPIDYDSRCIKRQEIVETLEKELPPGTIKYSSRVISIEQSGVFKLVHLADKTVLRTKVLIGCDGVNSVVAKCMGLQKPVDANRSAIRGYVEYPKAHGFEPKFCAYFGGGVRIGFLPCDDKSLYWFCTFTPSDYDEKIEGSPTKMKQFVLSLASNVSKEAYNILERTSLDSLHCAKLKLRSPWDILKRDNIVKNNTCLVGDALHPMTPDIGQGGCSALEDSVVLARCISEAIFARKLIKVEKLEEGDELYKRIKVGLEKYAKERKWRIFSLISTSYLVGLAQESNGMVISYLREKFLAQFTIKTMLKMGDFDCGKLLK
ncbi:monooxygenase 2-like [Lycium ferocissimum]|uniref:monooxygenase 2-like n=1 Tax=Lycium ferocissimum TaxID=112874 RepID=UPI002814CC21|nr:monooxygenase 2-like [Lycium ferocissimum]